jgi:hypothetical protein
MYVDISVVKLQNKKELKKCPVYSTLILVRIIHGSFIPTPNFLLSFEMRSIFIPQRWVIDSLFLGNCKG